MDGSPPLRQSLRDPDLDWAVASATEVLIDGVVQVGVIEYDVDAGYVIRQVVDDHGQLVIDVRSGRVREERVEGVASVRWRA